MEALAWETAHEPAPESARLRELTDLVAGDQQDDGYLNTYFGHKGGPAVRATSTVGTSSTGPAT